MQSNRRPLTSYSASAQHGGVSQSGSTSLLDRAMALQHAGDFAAADEAYRDFLDTHPKHLAALNNAAIVAKALGKRDIALLRLGKAVRHHPNSAEAHFNLANTLQELGRLGDSITYYRRAIGLKPNYAKAHLNLGNALDNLRQFHEAAECYQQALRHGGENAEVHANLAQCLKQQGRLHDALVHFTCATTLEPNRADFHYGVGITRFELRDNQDAIVSFRRVLELEPTHEGARNAMLFQAQLTCDWAVTATLAPLVYAATDEAFSAGKRCSEGAFESLTRNPNPARNQAVAISSAQGVDTVARVSRPKLRRAKRDGRKIRLGYLSGDFREHPVAQVIGGVFGRHDRQRFEVYAYSYGIDDGSSWRRRISTESDRFVDLYNTSDDEAVRRIAEDEIDVLIDLTLWTHGSRIRICAARPAAVQVQYLGFPGTSGAPFYDYAVVDKTVVRPEDRPYWTENLVFMPHAYFVTDNDQPIAATGLRRLDCGLPEHGVVFCSFNQSYKIEPVVFAAWTEILKQVPGSVLWLSRHPYATEVNLLQAASRAGIAAGRLAFADKVADKAEHLERLGLADIALDTLAYNGHTTTTDALWAGVPVVTVNGSHFASRVSASLLRAAELEELVEKDVGGYVCRAVQLATDNNYRTSLRSYLAGARLHAPLFDTGASVSALERAYLQMWAKYCAGSRPSDIDLAREQPTLPDVVRPAGLSQC